MQLLPAGLPRFESLDECAQYAAAQIDPFAYQALIDYARLEYDGKPQSHALLLAAHNGFELDCRDWYLTEWRRLGGDEIKYTLMVQVGVCLYQKREFPQPPRPAHVLYCESLQTTTPDEILEIIRHQLLRLCAEVSIFNLTDEQIERQNQKACLGLGIQHYAWMDKRLLK